MSCLEQQEEELEVLQSIYDGDDAFNQVNEKCFQYKIGDDNTNKSFVLEIVWGEDYPDSLPDINLNAFFNKHLYDHVKVSAVNKIKEEADANCGCAMTYTLIEFAKENADDLMIEQTEAPVQEEPKEQVQQTAKVKVKKEQLTKAQKRKITQRTNQDGELPRGYDWVDVIKHLSQTGGKDMD